MENTRDNNKLLLLGGPQRFLTQYSAAVPQNLIVSILQGAVFALLITQPLQIPTHFSVSAILALLLEHHFYMLSINSVLIILIVWQIFVFSSLLFILPPTFLVSGLIFLLTAAEAIMVKSIDNFPAWMIFAGVVQVVGGIFRCYTRRLLTPQDFERRVLGRIVLNYELHYGVKYIILGSIGIGLGLGYDNLLVLLEKVNTQQVATDVLQWSMSILALLNITAVIIADRWYKHDIYRVMSKTIALGRNGLVRGHQGLPLRRKMHVRGKQQCIPPVRSSLPLEGEAGRMLEVITVQPEVTTLSSSVNIETGHLAQQCQSLDEDKSLADKEQALRTEA